MDSINVQEIQRVTNFLSYLICLTYAVPVHGSTFIEISPPGFEVSEVIDMSADGSLVVGRLGIEEGNLPSNYKGFSWTENEGLVVDPWSEYGFLLQFRAVVSPDGSAIASDGFVLTPDMELIKTPPSEIGFVVTALSNNGDLAIIRTNVVGPNGRLWSPTGIQFEQLPSIDRKRGFVIEPSDISGDGDFVAATRYFLDERGTAEFAESEAFLLSRDDTWTMRGLGIPPGWEATWPTAISNDGKAVAGFAIEFFDRNEAFVWTETSGLELLGTLTNESDSSRANDVSDDGKYVVGFTSENRNWCCGPRGWAPDSAEPFIWTSGRGMLNLQDVLETQYALEDELNEFDLLSADKISHDGMRIAGSGLNREGQRVGWIARLDHPLDAIPGDANLDGEFNAADLVSVLQASQFEDGMIRNSSWASGDWNGDKEFDTADIIVALQAGNYRQGPIAAGQLVPEPSSVMLAVIGFLGCLGYVRRR